MSRTFRTNKYGEVKTDKFKEFVNRDDRNLHIELRLKKEIEDDYNFIHDRYNEFFNKIDYEDHFLDSLNLEILKYNRELYL